MRSKLFLAGLAAAIVMAFAANGASARNISMSHGNLFTAEWRPIRFVSGGSTTAECNLTLEGSFHYRTFLKVRGALIGYITRATANSCTSGSVTVLTERLPWHITYESFEGTLPNITGLRLNIIGAEFRLHERIFNTECLTRTETARPSQGVARLGAGSERRLVTGLTADATRIIRCGIIEAGFEGTARVKEVPGGSENLLIRLI